MSCIYVEWLRKVAREVDNNAYGAVCYEAARQLEETIKAKEDLQHQVEDLKQKLEDSEITAQTIQGMIDRAISSTSDSTLRRLLKVKIDRALQEVRDIKACLDASGK